MRIWADCDDKCLPLVCVDVSLRELWPARLIAAVPECLVDFNVQTCGANAMIPFGLCPDCDLICGSRSDFQKNALPDH